MRYPTYDDEIIECIKRHNSATMKVISEDIRAPYNSVYRAMLRLIKQGRIKQTSINWRNEKVFAIETKIDLPVVTMNNKQSNLNSLMRHILLSAQKNEGIYHSQFTEKATHNFAKTLAGIVWILMHCDVNSFERDKVEFNNALRTLEKVNDQLNAIRSIINQLLKSDLGTFESAVRLPLSDQFDSALASQTYAALKDFTKPLP